MATAAPTSTAVPNTPAAPSAAVEIALIKQRQRDRVASLPKGEVQEYQESKQNYIPSPLHVQTPFEVRTHLIHPAPGPATHTLINLTHAFAHFAHLYSLPSFR